MATHKPFHYLLSPYKNERNDLTLKNRIVLAPMTRCQSDNYQVPSDNMLHFYLKRSGCGLLVSEATCITPNANAYPSTPGIYSNDQIIAWRSITQLVQDQGAKFFMQLWHPGMMGHSKCSNGHTPLSPSGLKPLRKFVPRLKFPYETPKIMDDHDFITVKNSFCQAAFNAIHKANFDGIELHASSGYLLDSFLHHTTNKRTDQYGGSPENMSRFLLDLINQLISFIKPNKIAVRISPIPIPSMQSIAESKADQEVFSYLLKQLSLLNLAYIHVSSDNDTLDRGTLPSKVTTFVRSNYNGTLIGGGNYSIHDAEAALKNNEFELTYFGRLLIANPNLVNLLNHGDLSDLKEFDTSMITNSP